MLDATDEKKHVDTEESSDSTELIQNHEEEEKKVDYKKEWFWNTEVSSKH